MAAEASGSPPQNSTRQHTSSGAMHTVARNVKPFQAFLTKFTNDWSMNLAAGLAYNLILAMFPLVIAVMAILGFMVGNLDPAVYTTLTHQLENSFPAVTASHNLIASALLQLEKDSGVLGILAILLATFNGSRLFVFMEGCLDIIYQVRPRAVIPQNVIALLMVLLFVILIPLMVVASLGPTFVFSALQKTPVGLLPGSSLLLGVGGILGGLIASYLLFQVMYLVVPHQNIRVRQSWQGSVIAAVLLETYLALFPLYATRFLGAFSGAISLLILLVFFYYFAVILFLGAEVNAYIAGVRVTPHDLVTMVHIMTGSLPRRVQAGEDGATASRQDGEPEESLPKNEI
jgi:membrane protein